MMIGGTEAAGQNTDDVALTHIPDRGHQFEDEIVSTDHVDQDPNLRRNEEGEDQREAEITSAEDEEIPHPSTHNLHLQTGVADLQIDESPIPQGMIWITEALVEIMPTTEGMAADHPHHHKTKTKKPSANKS